MQVSALPPVSAKCVNRATHHLEYLALGIGKNALQRPELRLPRLLMLPINLLQHRRVRRLRCGIHRPVWRRSGVLQRAGRGGQGQERGSVRRGEARPAVVASSFRHAWPGGRSHVAICVRVALGARSRRVRRRRHAHRPGRRRRRRPLLLLLTRQVVRRLLELLEDARDRPERLAHRALDVLGSAQDGLAHRLRKGDVLRDRGGDFAVCAGAGTACTEKRGRDGFRRLQEVGRGSRAVDRRRWDLVFPRRDRWRRLLRRDLLDCLGDLDFELVLRDVGKGRGVETFDERDGSALQRRPAASARLVRVSHGRSRLTRLER